MKILFIRSTSGVSGAEKHTMWLTKGLLGQKIDVGVMTNYLPFFKRLQDEKIPSQHVFFPVPEMGTKKEAALAILWFLYMIPMYLWQIRRMEQGKRFDTVVLTSMTEKLLLSPYLSLFGYRVIWIEHGPMFRTERSAIVKWLYRRKAHWVQRIIAVSKDTASDLVKGGVSKALVTVVPIGVPAELLKPTLNSKKLSGKKQVTIGFVGSITREKGCMDFGDAMYALSLQHLPCHFLVVGGGPLLSFAKKRVEELGIESHVTCTGYVPDAVPYIKKMDILFFPTHHEEGLSIALLEALALGKIVVSRDIGGNRELIQHKKTGFLFTKTSDGITILKGLITGTLRVKDISKQAQLLIHDHFNLKTQLGAFIDVFACGMP